MSEHSTDFPLWPVQMARFLSHAGSDCFPGELVDWLLSFVTTDCAEGCVGWVTLSQKGYPPLILYQIKNDARREKLLESYRNHYHLLDPAYNACVESDAHGFFEFHQLAPDEFQQTEYYREHYQFDAGLDDEVDYIFRLSEGAAVNISLGLRRGRGQFNKTGIETLKALTPLVEQLTFLHWKPAQLREHEFSAEDSSFHTKLTEAYEKFGTSFLTPREQEVVWLMLRGHSLRSAADKMGVSSSTIKEHRKNIYVKLDISSHAELFVLFFEALKHSEGANEDPLENYLVQ